MRGCGRRGSRLLCHGGAVTVTDTGAGSFVAVSSSALHSEDEGLERRPLCAERLQKQYQAGVRPEVASVVDTCWPSHPCEG